MSETFKIMIAKDIEKNLNKNPLWTGKSKEYPKDNKTYHHDGMCSDLKPMIDGKKVKYWLKVYVADDSIGDEYAPIF